MVYSLPSLKLLLDIEFLADLRYVGFTVGLDTPPLQT